MTEEFIKKEYQLLRNPFPPAATGIDLDIKEDKYVPKAWIKNIENYYKTLSSGEGVKAFPVIGLYGTGKTVLLNSYLREFFEEKRIKTFYFENLGIKFYDLANTLMRNLGRYEFSKALWEICKEYLQEEQLRLFPMSFRYMLSNLKKKSDRIKKAGELKTVLKDKLKLTDDEEVAYKLASMIVETAEKPYFEYRDFVAGTKGSLVAEGEEPKYFKAIINALIKVYNVEGVAFLIDEFEDVAISKRMTRSMTYEYLATLRHLIDISEKENLWIVMAMTPEAAKETEEMNSALWVRFTHNTENALNLNPLSKEESKELLIWWLNRARKTDDLKHWQNKLYPFPEELLTELNSRPELRIPRTIVKIGFFTLSEAEKENIKAPIPVDFIRDNIINKFYKQDLRKSNTN